MSISGNLRTLEFAELLQWLAQGQKTGALVIDNGHVEKRIYFKEGKIISSQSNNPAEHLGAFMVREGLLDEETLARAVKLQESTQILLGKVLVTLGTISEEELHRILRRKTEESLFELFNWIEGDFRFLPDDLPKLPMVPIEIDVTNVVLEGAKRFDEARRDGKVSTGDYGQEIEDMLSSEIFQGIDVGESGDQAQPETEQEEPTEVGSYYSGAGKKSGRPVLAAAVAIAAIVIGVSAYFFMRPDPAAGTADRATLERAFADDGLTVDDDLYQPLEPESVQDDLTPAEDSTEVVGAVAAPDQSEEMQARYEAELDTLKKQLQQAQLVAAERDEAMNKIAELEDKVAQAQEAAAFEPVTQPQAQLAVAQLGDPIDLAALSAGGDEAPPLGSPLPSTEADQEAGTEFATEMVESAPIVPIPEAVEASPPPLEEPVEEITIEEPEPLVKSPVLLSRIRPRYPAAAMRLGKEAIITLRLLVDIQGKVVDVERVGTDPGMGFAKSAINAALTTKWESATSDGKPIEMWTEIRIAFKP